MRTPDEIRAALAAIQKRNDELDAEYEETQYWERDDEQNQAELDAAADVLRWVLGEWDKCPYTEETDTRD